MDPAALIGMVVAIAAILASNVLEGGNPMSLLLIPPLILVWFGSIGAGVASGTMSGFISSLKWAAYAIKAKKQDPEQAVEPLVKMAERARREGLLALEQELETIDDPFLKKGVQMAVDGTDPDDLWEILAAEVKAKKTSAANGAKFWNDAGGYAPTIGIVGTVMGLVHVLENLGDPEQLGHMVAAAFVATLWGVMSANVIYLPMGARIKAVGAAEAETMELVIDGVLAIQAGANPRVVATKLRSKMPAGPGETKEAA